MKTLRHILPISALVLFTLFSAGCNRGGENTDDPKNDEENPIVDQPEEPRPDPKPDPFTPPPTGKIPVLRIDLGDVFHGEIDGDRPGLEHWDRPTFPATMTIEDPEGVYSSTATETVDIEIHGRGNSSWWTWDGKNDPGIGIKRPYKIKLNDSKEMLGMPANKHWVLLANHSDKTFLRNTLAFKLSEIVGMSWTPRSVPVELYFNDYTGESYRGLYQLVEHVRVDPERIDMTVAGPNDDIGDALSGGYLMCVDYKNLDEDKAPGFAHQNRSDRIPFAFEEPENPTPVQVEYLKSVVRDAENAIYDLPFEEYSKVVDVKSFVQYFFINELAKNPDGNMRLSTYMWKPRGGNLGFACVWDFDLSFGNYDTENLWTPTGWHIRNAVWFRQLFRNQDFCDYVLQEWRRLYPELSKIEPLMRLFAAQIDEGQQNNEAEWDIQGKRVWPNYAPNIKPDYEGEFQFLIDWFGQRAEWMNQEIEAGRHKYN